MPKKKSWDTPFWYAISSFLRFDFSYGAFLGLTHGGNFTFANVLLSNTAFIAFGRDFRTLSLEPKERQRLHNWLARDDIKSRLVIDEKAAGEVVYLFEMEQMADRPAFRNPTMNANLDSRILVLRATAPNLIYSPQVHYADCFHYIVVLLPRRNLDSVGRFLLLHEIAHTTKFAVELRPYVSAPIVTSAVLTSTLILGSQEWPQFRFLWLILLAFVVWNVIFAPRLEEVYCDAYAWLCLFPSEKKEVSLAYPEFRASRLHQWCFRRFIEISGHDRTVAESVKVLEVLVKLIGPPAGILLLAMAFVAVAKGGRFSFVALTLFVVIFCFEKFVIKACLIRWLPVDELVLSPWTAGIARFWKKPREEPEPESGGPMQM